MTLLVLGVLVLIPGPVVGGVDEEGVLTQAEILESIEQATRLIIEFLHHVAVEPALGFSAEAVGGIDDGVHHGMGQVEREGLLGIALFLRNSIDLSVYRVVSPPMSRLVPAGSLFSWNLTPPPSFAPRVPK